jgi:hypothetical protein
MDRLLFNYQLAGLQLKLSTVTLPFSMTDSPFRRVVYTSRHVSVICLALCWNSFVFANLKRKLWWFNEKAIKNATEGACIKDLTEKPWIWST